MDKWHEPQTVAFWLAIAGVLVFLLVFAVIRLSYLSFGQVMHSELELANAQLMHQKKLLETSLLVQEKERRRVAADLHDGLIGRMMSIHLKQQLLTNDPALDLLMQESIAEARRISHDLCPPMIEHEPLHELMEGVLDPWRDQLAVWFYKDIRTIDRLSGDARIQLVRILQELLTNTLRHARAERLFVHLRCGERATVLLVRDDGCGFDAGHARKGLGMYSIELRMLHLGGSYKVRSAPGRGASFLCHIPHTDIPVPC